MASGNSRQEFYYASEAEVRAAQERAAMRDMRKAEYAKMTSNPAFMTKNVTYYTNHHSVKVFDPALQRFLSMKNCRDEFFKPTARNMQAYFWVVIFPIAIAYKYKRWERITREEVFGSGQIPYKERLWKLFT